jgi:hypothetical protein
MLFHRSPLWARTFSGNEIGEAVTVTADHYINVPHNLRLQFQEMEYLEQLWLQQNGATYHTTTISMVALREVFSGRLISPFVSVMFSGQVASKISQPMISLHGVI